MTEIWDIRELLLGLFCKIKNGVHVVGLIKEFAELQQSDQPDVPI